MRQESLIFNRGIQTFLLFLSTAGTLCDAGSITGRGRFEKIAGNPAAGYQELYEWDLYVSPPDNSLVGPARRLGAPPGQQPTHNGYYRVDDLPAGTYSVYVNQPDFFASPKVAPEVEVRDGRTTRLDVVLDVDYSTYFANSNEWTGWEWDLLQTFEAVGTSVRGVTWRMAGSGQYRGKSAQITILEDNGRTNPNQWTPIGTAVDDQLSADSDEWVRWTSGEVPLTPGRQYAVKVHIDGGMAIYKRNKDAQSYANGSAYTGSGARQNYDLNITVFTDRGGQIVTHTTKSPGPGRFDGGLSDNRWGQTFVATGRSLAAIDLFAASAQDDIELTWAVYKDGPTGEQVGPTKTTRGAYFASSTDLIGVSFNPAEVPLTPGETYYIDVFNSRGITPYLMQPWEAYSDGRAYRNGVATSGDLSMTIMEYSVVPEPSTLWLLAGALLLLVNSVRRTGTTGQAF